MKRIGTGYFSVAYRSTDTQSIILFSIDPLKEVMADFVIDNPDFTHFPKIEKIGDELVKGEYISIYRMERLVTLNNVIKRSRSEKRQYLVDDYEMLFHELHQSCFVKGWFRPHMLSRYERFEKWMELLENSDVYSYVPAFKKIFDYFYGRYSENLAFDFHKNNVAVRPYQNTLILSDIWAVDYLCTDDDYRISFYNDKLLRSIYSE